MLPVQPNLRRCVGAVKFSSHIAVGGLLVWEWGITLYLHVSSIISYSHIFLGMRAWDRAQLAAFLLIRFSLSAIPFIWGWFLIVVVWFLPFSIVVMGTCCDLYSLALSVSYQLAGFP